jgi:hypothetical protein
MASAKMKFGLVFQGWSNVIDVLHVDHQRNTRHVLKLDEYRMHVGPRCASLVTGKTFAGRAARY